MGWSSTNWKKGTKIIDWFKDNYTYENKNVKQTVLDTALVQRQHAYAAIEQLNKETGERTVTCATVLMNWTRDLYYNFSYKNMSEHSGPGMYDCPERIIKLLTPITKPDNKDCGDQWARNWRAKTWKEIRKRKANKRRSGQFKVGDTIIFRRPVCFNNGTSHKQLTVHRLKPFELTDGSQGLFGSNIYKMKRRNIDYLMKKVIPAGQKHEPEIVLPDISGKNIDKFPVFKMKEDGPTYRCIAWANSLKIGWEWFSFDIIDKNEAIYYGFVHGNYDEFGNFSAKELAENGISFITDPKELHNIMPPIGWEKVD